MRKEEHVKIIPERKEVTYKYYSKCPFCGFEQIYNYESKDIDKECSECKQKREKKERQDFLDSYIGSTILNIKGNTIIIKTKLNNVYELWFHTDSDNSTELEIVEIHTGNAEWFE